ncbi:CPBP family glutamic-type intramembrane protease [Nitrospira sp. Kam-Ns4a]
MAWLPVAATGSFYVLPADLQGVLVIQFLPQVLAYLGLALWAARNRGVAAHLGLGLALLGQGLRWGLPTGLALGCLNTAVILWIVPALGGDIQFLRETPHARVPPAVMLPWAITLIAVGVELNFRGFLLGRLLALWQSPRGSRYHRGSAALAIAVSALVFAYDPFLVATFRHLHWIAVWDGAVWGTLRVGLGNLYAPIVAHAVEVLILYSILRTVLA